MKGVEVFFKRDAYSPITQKY